MSKSGLISIALFTDNFTHLHYNTIQRGHKAISGCFVIFARNCLAFAFNFIVMEMLNIIREKGDSPLTTDGEVEGEVVGAARVVAGPMFSRCLSPPQRLLQWRNSEKTEKIRERKRTGNSIFSPRSTRSISRLPSLCSFYFDYRD